MIFDPFVTLGYVEDIKVLVQPSNTVPYVFNIYFTFYGAIQGLPY